MKHNAYVTLALRALIPLATSLLLFNTGCAMLTAFATVDDYPTDNTRAAENTEGLKLESLSMTLVDDERAALDFKVNRGYVACTVEQEYRTETSRGLTALALLADIGITSAIWYKTYQYYKTMPENSDGFDKTFGFWIGAGTLWTLGGVGNGLIYLFSPAAVKDLRPEYGTTSWQLSDVECPAGTPLASQQVEVSVADGRFITVTTDDFGWVPAGSITAPLDALRANPRITVTAAGLPTLATRLEDQLQGLESRRSDLPPQLVVEGVQLVDESGDGAISGGESAIIEVEVRNEGRGPGLISAAIECASPHIKSLPASSVQVAPGAVATLSARVAADPALVGAPLRIKVLVREERGFDADPLTLAVEGREARYPKVVLAGVVVDDDSGGDSFGNGNQKIEPGEQVELTLVVQNQGKAKATSARLALQSRDAMVILDGTTSWKLGELEPGQVVRKKALVVVTKTFAGTGQLPIDVTIESAEAEPQVARLPVKLHAASAKVALVEIESKESVIKDAKAGAEVDRPFPTASLPPDLTQWALVIGIEDYVNAPSAKYTARDAQRVMDTLQHLGVPKENTKLLLNKEATYGSIRAAITWLKNNVEEGDRVTVFFAGHGVPGVEDKTAYLVPHDGDPNYPADTAIALPWLKSKLEGLSAGQIVLFLDACFTGEASRGAGKSLLANARPLLPKLDHGTAGSERMTVISAAKSDQISSGDEKLKHGLFSNYLLMGLRGRADANGDRTITIGELFKYLEPQVKTHARRLNRTQDPEMKGEGESWGYSLGRKKSIGVSEPSAPRTEP